MTNKPAGVGIEGYMRVLLKVDGGLTKQYGASVKMRADEHTRSRDLGHEGTSTLTMRYGQLSRKLLEIGSRRGSCFVLSSWGEAKQQSNSARKQTPSAAHRPGYPGMCQSNILHFARQRVSLGVGQAVLHGAASVANGGRHQQIDRI